MTYKSIKHSKIFKFCQKVFYQWPFHIITKLRLSVAGVEILKLSSGKQVLVLRMNLTSPKNLKKYVVLVLGQYALQKTRNIYFWIISSSKRIGNNDKKSDRRILAEILCVRNKSDSRWKKGNYSRARWQLVHS